MLEQQAFQKMLNNKLVNSQMQIKLNKAGTYYNENIIGAMGVTNTFLKNPMDITARSSSIGFGQILQGEVKQREKLQKKLIMYQQQAKLGVLGKFGIPDMTLKYFGKSKLSLIEQ